MKHQPLLSKAYLLTCIFIFPICNFTWSQLPGTNWALHFADSVDIPFVIKFTADGGTIAAGNTDSKDAEFLL
ncbi:MAG: hypothetical protein ABI741_02940 [Ferruginibacter sp.]